MEVVVTTGATAKRGVSLSINSPGCAFYHTSHQYSIAGSRSAYNCSAHGLAQNNMQKYTAQQTRRTQGIQPVVRPTHYAPAPCKW